MKFCCASNAAIKNVKIAGKKSTFFPIKAFDKSIKRAAGVFYLKGNAPYLKKNIMDENDALSEYYKIPLWLQSYQWSRLLQNLLQS